MGGAFPGSVVLLLCSTPRRRTTHVVALGRCYPRFMPELPDISVYIERLAAKVQGAALQRVKVANPFVLRTAVPAITAAEGWRVTGVERLGKRVVIELEEELFLVIHLMVAGRLRWRDAKAKPLGRQILLALEFDTGTLSLTEAGTQRRASLHLVHGRDALAALDPGGLDVLAATATEFTQRLKRANHTLKRALTDPHLFGGIGNAYSDEILHRARLSPTGLTQSLTDAAAQALHEAACTVLKEWTNRLHEQAGDWPEKVTAFHPEMAVHGRFGLPCPVCGAKVARIVHASNETNYCPRCQTGGRLLADRALSRLLKASWPKNIDK